jgi:ABC-type antimicrobial peptide transport system permease subunit
VDVSTLDRLVERSASEYRMAAQLAAALGLLGLVLAAIGLYGVMAYGATLRTREIGIRMAVGARAPEAAGLILRQALWLTLAGIGAGLPLSMGAARAMRSLLFGVSPWSPTPVLMGAALLVSISVVAAWLPARRAARVDPMEALRHE